MTEKTKERLKNRIEPALIYLEKSDKEIVKERLEEYIKELNETEDFFNYFNGYEDEEGWHEAKGSIYSVNWILEDNLFEDGVKALQYQGARVMTGYGGPNLYLDTRQGIGGIVWGAKRLEAPLERETIDRLDEYFEDFFEYRIKYR